MIRLIIRQYRQQFTVGSFYVVQSGLTKIVTPNTDTTDYYLSDVDTNNQHDIICIKLPIYPIKSHSTGLAKSHHYNLRTRDNWYNINVGDLEKTVQLHGQAMHGKDVEKTCSKTISSVILPENAAENEDYRQFGYNFGTDWWLGINGRAKNGSYLKMKDGLSVNYTNWTSPPDLDWPNMAMMNRVDGKWHSREDGDTHAERQAHGSAKFTLCEKDILSKLIKCTESSQYFSPQSVRKTGH